MNLMYLPLHDSSVPLLTDADFDRLYSKRMQQLSTRHWTPIKIAASAAAFLAADPKSRILDIGAGVGKFCLAGAQRQPGSHFYGIEQRKNLVQYAEKARKRLALENVTFIHGNFTELDLSRFDHFFFYNSFYENLVDAPCHIDERVDYSVYLYEYYTQYLYRIFEQRPFGTKLVTYHSFREIVPGNYRLMDYGCLPFLKCWMKD